MITLESFERIQHPGLHLCLALSSSSVHTYETPATGGSGYLAEATLKIYQRPATAQDSGQLARHPGAAPHVHVKGLPQNQLRHRGVSENSAFDEAMPPV